MRYIDICPYSYNYFSNSNFFTTFHVMLQDVTLFSWYEVALRLRLPDLVTPQSKDLSIMENLVQALVNESSTKNRRPVDVTLSGLATMPKTISSLPSINNNTTVDGTQADETNKSSASRPLSAPRNSPAKEKKRQDYIIKRQVDTTERFGKFGNNANNKVSVDNWIPEETRMRSLHRDIAVAKLTLTDIQKKEMGQDKELKRLRTTDLQRAQTEESLGTVKKINCACCMRKFLYVNLPLKVSKKAIMDIRIKWSGNLSSANVFGADEEEGNEPGTPDKTSKGKTGKKDKDKEKSKSKDLLSIMYNEVRVCFFCAQFFHDQEGYRPSFATIVYEEKKAAYMENKKKELQYWDPLQMVENDREMLEQRIKEKEALALTAAPTSS